MDGEADPDFSFGGLMTLVRHAQIDFGVRIEPALNEIRPNPQSGLSKRYRITHPDFPHQTTLNQFFDEEQFEAYRQLGVHEAEGLFSRALMGEGVGPASVRDWFQRLVSCCRNEG